MKTRHVSYTIYLDYFIDALDIEIRLYWTGDSWDSDVEYSMDFDNSDSAKIEALLVKKKYSQFSICVLEIVNETNTQIYKY